MMDACTRRKADQLSALLLHFLLVAVSFAAPPTLAAVEQSPRPPEVKLEAGVVTSPPPTRSLDLATCFERAEAHNKEIISAKWNLTIAKAQITSAAAIPNPKFQLQEGFGPAFSKLFTGQTEQILWTQQIQTAGKGSKKVAVAVANYKLAEKQFEALRFDVHNRVRRAYAELVAAEAYEELIEAQREVSLKLLATAEKRFQAGKAAKTEVLQAKLNVWQFNTQRNQSKIRLEQASAALSLIIGETPETIEIIGVVDNSIFQLSADKTEIVPSPTQPLPELNRLFETAKAERPDLKAAKEQLSVNRKVISLAKAQRIPDLTVGGGYSFAAFSKTQPAGLTAQPNSLGNGLFLGVSLENPIFYQYQGEVKRAIGSLRQVERQYDLLECQAAGDVTTAYNEVLVSKTNIALFQAKLLPTAAEAARIARRRYEVGKSDLASAIVAQGQYQQILLNYFDSVVAYQNAWSDLEKAVGLPLRL